MQERCLIYYWGTSWGETPGRQVSLIKALSKYIPIIYLDDSIIKKGRVICTQVEPNITLIQGLTHVLGALKRRQMNQAASCFAHLHLRWLKREFQHITLWYSEAGNQFYKFLPYDSLVYDCIDPCFSKQPQERALHYKNENEIIQASTQVFATADILLERCRTFNPNVALLNNACDPAEYTPAKLAGDSRPGWWPNTQNPIAVYLGGMNERFDFDYAEYACRTNPNVHFVFTGGVNPDFISLANHLRTLPNVSQPGFISNEDVCFLLSKSSVGLIPFKIDEIGDAINPNKMYIYALLGIPIVGTATREMASRPEIVFAADTPEKFSQAIQQALAQKKERMKQLKEYGLQNTWDIRAEQAWQMIKELK